MAVDMCTCYPGVMYLLPGAGPLLDGERRDLHALLRVALRVEQHRVVLLRLGDHEPAGCAELWPAGHETPALVVLAQQTARDDHTAAACVDAADDAHALVLHDELLAEQLLLLPAPRQPGHEETSRPLLARRLAVVQ